MRVNADPDEIDPDNLDPEAPDYAAECQIDHDEFKYNPVQIRFIHMDQRTSNKKLIGRSLMWHEDDLQTDVSTERPRTWVGLTGFWNVPPSCLGSK